MSDDNGKTPPSGIPTLADDPKETCCICQRPIDLTKRVVIYMHGAMAHPNCHQTARIVRHRARKAAKAKPQ